MVHTVGLTDGTINFLVTSAAFAFAVFAGTRATETLSIFSARPKDYMHLNSLSVMSVIILLCSFFPLIFAELDKVIQVSSGLSAAITFLFVSYTTLEIWRKKLEISHKYSTLILIFLSFVCVLLMAVNYFISSIIMYKIIIVISQILLFYRFHLVLHSVISRPE